MGHSSATGRFQLTSLSEEKCSRHCERGKIIFSAGKGPKLRLRGSPWRLPMSAFNDTSLSPEANLFQEHSKNICTILPYGVARWAKSRAHPYKPHDLRNYWCYKWCRMSYKSKVNVTNYYSKVLIAFYCLIYALFIL